MFKSIFTNSTGILTSRVLGFIRDMLTANILGAGVYSDIFFIAFKLPNLFRNIFAEGAFSQSFIPSYAASSHKPPQSDSHNELTQSFEPLSTTFSMQSFTSGVYSSQHTS